jgi:catechol 2,3-dioxygenase-like lactoylglutathione lyase family enzyme
MLRDFPISARIAASDIGRARTWYEQKLGFSPEAEEMGGMALWYRSGSTWFLLYQTEAAGTAKNTVGGWEVSDLDATLSDLRSRGVVFEEYDFGNGMATVDGVMTVGSHRAAWFRDSEGNVFELTDTTGRPDTDR